MEVAARRPYLAAGVALVGASVIAASSISPLPDVHLPDVGVPAISTANVDLAALANPLEVYAQVFQSALANVNTLAQNTVPGQVLAQILANQLSSAGTLGAGLLTTGAGIAGAAAHVPTTVTTAVAQLAAGNLSGAVNTLLGIPLAVAAPATALLPALQKVLTQPLQNIINVVNSFTHDSLATELLLSGLIAPLISTPAAAATAVQHIVNAVGTGNLSAIANAILTAPATIADGLLNGGYGPDLAPIVGQTGVVVKAGGLLNAPSLSVDPTSGDLVVNTGGPIAALQQILKQIATAIAPPAPAAVKVAQTDPAAIPAVASSTLTLTTATTATKTSTAATEHQSDDTTKDSKDSTTTTPAATKNGGESASTTKDSASQDAGASTTSKPTGKDKGVDVKGVDVKGVDVQGGNKVGPKPTGGSDSPKAGEAAGSTTKDGASTAEKGADKDAGAASKKGSTS